MAHGGTSFGFGNGASRADGTIELNPMESTSTRTTTFTSKQTLGLTPSTASESFSKLCSGFHP